MAELPHVGDDFGRYRIDDQIGFGGMGVVFGATDRVLGRRVALKVVSASLADSQEFLQRFAREASLLAKLDSPHVVNIYDYGEQGGCPFLVTQYVAGGDLGALLRTRGPMPPQLAAAVCAQVAEALADTHRVGVVHRDVKPSNVLLRNPNEIPLTAYLCDFGIARSDSDGLTQAGSVSGTWGYLAPEVGLGRPASPASDIYAVGCVLWAALFGGQPYRGNDVEVAIAHQRSPVPQVAGRDAFAQRLNKVLAGCLAKDPQQRYADASALRAELVALAAIPSNGVRPAEGFAGAGGHDRSGSGARRPAMGAPSQPSHPSRPSQSSRPGQPPPGLYGPPPASGQPPRPGVSQPSQPSGAGQPSPLPAAYPVGQPDVHSLPTVLPGAAGPRFAQPPAPGGPMPGPAARGRSPRRTVLIAVAAVVVLVVAAGGIVALVQPWHHGGSATADGTGTPTVSPTTPADTGTQGDLDGDGFGDVQARIFNASGDHDQGSYLTTTWLSTGKRLQAPRTMGAQHSDTVLSTARADLDGDGRPEVLTCRVSSTDIGCSAKLSGGGRLEDETALLPGTQSTVVPLLGDVNGDGKADLIIASYRFSQKAETDVGKVYFDVALNESTSFGPAHRWAAEPIPAGEDPEFTVGDVTGDGKADLVYSTVNDGYPHASKATIDVLPSDGTSFTTGGPTATIDTKGWFPDAILVADVNGDGKPEIFYASQSATTAYVFVLTTGATLGRPVLWGTENLTGFSTELAAIGLSDVNGDGKDDLVLAGQVSATTGVVDIGLSTGHSFAAPRKWGDWPQRIRGAYPTLLSTGNAP